MRFPRVAWLWLIVGIVLGWIVVGPRLSRG